MKKIAVFGNAGAGKSTLSRRLAHIAGLPAGWPEGSSLLKGMLNSYRTVRLCHAKLTPRYREYVEQAKATKQVYHLRWSCGPVFDHRPKISPSSTRLSPRKLTLHRS